MQQEDMEEYAGEALTIQEPQGTNYTVGAVVNRTIPAKWWNWLFRAATKRLHQLFSDMTSLSSEVLNVSTDVDPSGYSTFVEGVSQHCTNQVMSYVHNLRHPFMLATDMEIVSVHCSGLTGLTLDEFVSFSISTSGAYGIVVRDTTVYVLRSLNLTDWTVALTQTFRGGYNTSIYAGVQTTDNGRVACVIHVSHSYVGGFDMIEQLCCSCDGVHWITSVDTSFSNIETCCSPAIIRHGVDLYYLRGDTRTVYNLRTSLDDAQFGLASNFWTYTMSGVPSYVVLPRLHDWVVCSYNCAVKGLSVEVNSVNVILAGNLSLSPSHTCTLISLTGTTEPATAMVEAFKEDTGNYIIGTYNAYSEGSHRLEVTSSFFLSKDNGQVSRITTGAYRKSIPGAITTESVADNMQTLIVTYLAGTFNVPFLFAHHYSQSGTVLFDNGYYYLLTASELSGSQAHFKIYKIEGRLSANASDYELVNDLGVQNVNDMNFCNLGISGTWFGDTAMSHAVFKGYGKQLVSTAGVPLEGFDSATIVVRQPDGYLLFPTFLNKPPVKLFDSVYKVNQGTLIRGPYVRRYYDD